MTVEKIYFDLDDTLADFSLGLLEVCGIEPVAQEKSTPEQDNAMWEAIKNAGNFYYRLEECKLGMELFNTLRDKYGEKVEILSAVPKEKRGIVTAEEDKRQWVKEHLGEDVKVNIVHSAKDKKNYVTDKGSILFDDLKKNVDSWREAGGTGIWFNKDDIKHTLSELDNAGFKEICILDK